MPKPVWEPTPAQRRKLASLKRKFDRKAKVDEEYRAELFEVRAEGQPDEIPILHIAAALGIERKSVYRHLGKRMT